jgi:tetratricopeptide (TPR) repeat protein
LSTLTQQRPSAFLFELRGDNPGLAYALNQDVFRIGSDAENDLVLKDPGVALYQVEIHVLDGRHLIKNLSAHGNAYLNGESFEEAVLQKGDILTLGDATVRFVVSGEALSQEELWRPVGGRQKPVTARLTRPVRRASFLVALSLVAVGVVVFLVLRQPKQTGDGAQEESVKVPEAPATADRRELEAVYDQGMAYASARRWDQALAAFEKVRAEVPNYKDLDALYHQASFESQSVDALYLGKGLYLDGQWDEAKRTLKSIPEESLHFREAERLLRDLDVRINVHRLDKAREYLAQNDLMAARGEAEAILATNPDSEEATELMNEIRRALSRSRQSWYSYGGRAEPPAEANRALPLRGEAPSATARAEREQTAVKPSPPPHEEPAAKPALPVAKPEPRPAAPEPPRGSPEWNLWMARAAYRKGETDASLKYLEPLLARDGTDRLGRTARDMAQDLRTAVGYYHQAETLQGRRRYAEALDMWEKFLEADRKISGSPEGVFFQGASASLGRIYFQRGQKEFDAGNLVTASRFWNMAGRISPRDEDVKRGMRQLSDSAQKFYREGYSLQEINPERAVEIWKVVMQIVPPDHPYYQEAKRQISRYSGSP